MRRLSIGLALAIASVHADATIIAYEGFDYDAGVALNGRNGGSGFSSGWFVDEYSYVVGPGSLVDLGGITQVAITNGYNIEWETDEIRVATDWAGVTAATPEPTSIFVWSLLATCVLCFVCPRRYKPE